MHIQLGLKGHSTQQSVYAGQHFFNELMVYIYSKSLVTANGKVLRMKSS